MSETMATPAKEKIYAVIAEFAGPNELLGATFVAVGIEVTLMVQAARKLAGDFGLGTDAAMMAAGASAY